MAEETQPSSLSSEKPTLPVPDTEKEAEEKKAVQVETVVNVAASDVSAEDTAEGKAEGSIPDNVSFKEESNDVKDLIDPEKKALDQLKELIVAALANNEFSKPPPPPPLAKEEEKTTKELVRPDKEVDREKEQEEATKTEEVEPDPCLAPVKEEDVTKPEPCLEPAKEEEPDNATAEKEEKPAVSIRLAVALAEEMKEEEDALKTVQAEAEEAITSAAASEQVAVDMNKEVEKEKPPPPEPEQVFIWGNPLIGGEKSDTILLKFLRARDFKVREALTMIKNTIIWRKEFNINTLLNEDLGIPELEKVVFTHGQDKDGHPVCYNVYGEFQGKDLYQKAFGDEEKRRVFLRWRVQVLEKDIKEKLSFSPEGVCTMVQITDLKNSPGPGKKELRQATKQALSLLQDNYPEFVAKQIFINVPWWYLAFNKMIAPLFTQRTKSKFVFAGQSKSAETLFKYIAPEHVPVKYGGLSMDNDTEFCISDHVIDVSIKPSTKHVVTIPVTESTLVWELRVLGWDVSYGAEFVPNTEGGYTVIIQKMRKFSATNEPAVIKNSFKIGEPGKVIVTVDNLTSKKKKKLLYRYKTKSSTDTTE